jgi:MFS family permease
VLTGLAVGVAGSAGTAWVAELVPGHDKARASSLTTAANLAGVAAGPLLAGVLADFAPAPLRTPYVVYLGLLAWVIWRVSGVPETVASPVERLAEASFKPRLGVPADIRTRFAPPAVAAFASFAFGGYYAGLLPNLVSDDLGIASRAVAGGIVAEAYGIAALAVLASRRLASRDAMLWGLVLLLPGIGGLLLAKMSGSIAVLALGSAIGGAGLGLCYRGTLQVINAIAPAGQRAEVVSSFMIVCFLGNSLPVVGVAVAGRLASPQAAQFGFAGLVALLALLAFATGWKWVPKQA